MNEALLYLLQCKQIYNFLACRKLCSGYWCVKNLSTNTAERNVPRTRSWYRAQFLNIAMGLRNYLISLRNCTANIHFTWDALRGWRELIIWSDDVTSNACGERVLARRILWKRLSCRIKATLCQGLSPCNALCPNNEQDVEEFGGLHQYPGDLKIYTWTWRDLSVFPLLFYFSRLRTYQWLMQKG